MGASAKFLRPPSRDSLRALLDERHLRLLATLGDAGSLHEAAAALHYTPAAVSMRLTRLERELGLQLAERGPRGIALTDAGRRLSARAHVLLALHAESVEAARTAPVPGRDLVRISILPVARDRLLVPAARMVRERRPLQIRIRVADTEAAISDVREGLSDLAVVYDFDARRADLAGLDARWLVDDRIVTILPSQHRAADRRRLSLGHLATDAFVGAPLHSFAGPVFQGCCASVGFEPRVVATSPRELGIVDLVRARIGVAQVAMLGLDSGARDIIVRYTAEQPQRRLLLVRPSSERAPEAVEALCEALVERARRAREHAIAFGG